MRIVAFAVVEIAPKRFQPTKIVIVDGHIIAKFPLKEAMPYEPLAYEYLQGEVRQYYAGLWKEAKLAEVVEQPVRRNGKGPKREGK